MHSAQFELASPLKGSGSSSGRCLAIQSNPADYANPSEKKLGHDLGNRDQDKVDPGQESRFLARMAKILLNNFFTLLVKRNPTAIAI